MISLGGGSLPKFCYRYLLGADIEVVEIDPAVIALGDTFSIPQDNERFRVVQGDGADYVFESEAESGVLMVDGFDVQGMPAQLGSLEFYGDCYDFLAQEGILVVNLHLNRLEYQECLVHIQEIFGASTFEVMDDDMTNSIVFARKGEHFDMLVADPIRRPEAIAKHAWRQAYTNLSCYCRDLDITLIC